MNDYEKKMKHIGTYIRMYRQNKGISQSKLAEMVNVTRIAISEWENCKRIPSREHFCKICDVLDIPVDFFFPMFLRSKNV